MFSWHTLCVALRGDVARGLLLYSLWFCGCLKQNFFLPDWALLCASRFSPGPGVQGLSHSSFGVEADTELLEDERRARGWVQSLCSPQPGCLVLAAR